MDERAPAPPRRPAPVHQPDTEHTEAEIYLRALHGVTPALNDLHVYLIGWQDSIALELLDRAFRQAGAIVERRYDRPGPIDPAIYGLDDDAPSLPLGFAIDPDGDRIGLCVHGRWLGSSGTAQAAILAIGAGQGMTMAADLRIPRGVERLIRQMGYGIVWSDSGRAMGTHVGTGTPLGVEDSGHLYWARWHGYDDAIYGALRLAEAYNAGAFVERAIDREPVRERRQDDGPDLGKLDMEGASLMAQTPDGVRYSWPDGSFFTLRQTSDQRWGLHAQGRGEYVLGQIGGGPDA